MDLTVEEALQQAVEAHKAGKLQAAELLYRAILQAQPKHPDANHNLGLLAVSVNKAETALPLFRAALEANPNNGQFWVSYVDALIKERQLESARQVLEQGKQRGLVGDSVDALTSQLLRAGVEQESNAFLHGQTIPPEADISDLLNCYQQRRYARVQNLATSLVQKFPNHQLSWKVLGAALKQSGKLNEALIANQEAVRLVPDDAEAYNNLGITLRELGRLEEAEANYSTAIALKPRYAEAHNNRGVNLQQLVRLQSAELSYRNAIALRPDYAEAHSNLGNVLKELHRLEDAKASYSKAISLKPDFVEAHNNLSICLLESGDFTAALDSALRAIKLKSTFVGKTAFVESVTRINPHSWQPALAHIVETALLEPWGRPSGVSMFAGRLLKTNAAFLQLLERFKSSTHQDSNGDALAGSLSKSVFEPIPLLHAMLVSGPIADDELERFLSVARAQLLKAADIVATGIDSNDALQFFHCALAQQCFVNEYVYFQTAEEISAAVSLRDRLTNALKNNAAIRPEWVLAVACYFPLYSVKASEKLLHRNWPEAVKTVLKQQIEEHFSELKLSASIPQLTDIDNRVSLAVQNQYEENPYPRWVSLPRESVKRRLNAHIQNIFPSANFRRLADDRSPEILIAGCGTGQHPIGTAQSIKGASILAIDLSAASLAYAKRKTVEQGIESIEYAQADLLKLAALNRSFDVIESSGVLHHLENPFEGWKVLLALLRPNGFMRLGFYSELARRDIARVRNLIRLEGVGSSPQEIRNYRRHLLDLKSTEDYGFAVRNSDFFSTSGCRDLLFHAQEHRMNLDGIKDFLQTHHLNFLGFEVDRLVKRSYKNRFPNDEPATNLDYWRAYEEENPDTFASMYQFWIQRAQ